MRTAEIRRARREAVEVELCIGPEGVTMRRHDGDLEVAWNEVVAVIAWPDGEREVVASDQTTVTVDPLAWQRGRQAVAAIDKAVAVTIVNQHRRRPDPRMKAHATGPGPLRWALLATGAVVLVVLLVAVLQAVLDPALTTSVRVWSAIGASVLVAIAAQTAASLVATRRLQQRLRDTELDPDTA